MHRDAQVGPAARRWLRGTDLAGVPAPLVASLLALCDQADRVAADCADGTLTLGHMLPALHDRIAALAERIDGATRKDGLWNDLGSL